MIRAGRSQSPHVSPSHQASAAILKAQASGGTCPPSYCGSAADRSVSSRFLRQQWALRPCTVRSGTFRTTLHTQLYFQILSVLSQGLSLWNMVSLSHLPAPSTHTLFFSQGPSIPKQPHTPFLHPRPFMGTANSGRRPWDSHCAADPKRLHRPQGPLWVEPVRNTRAYQQYVTTYDNHGSAESRKSSLRNNLNLQVQGNLLDCLLVMNL